MPDLALLAVLWLVLTAAAVWVVGGAAREGRKGRIVGRKR